MTVHDHCVTGTRGKSVCASMGGIQLLAECLHLAAGIEDGSRDWVGDERDGVRWGVCRAGNIGRNGVWCWSGNGSRNGGRSRSRNGRAAKVAGGVKVDARREAARCGNAFEREGMIEHRAEE